ncbi:Putative Phage integrase (modular protein) [Nitrospira japonica]|uniref:Putative Phage integrase (Modular protein) n=1 Tax=Nitrospira japonica TaxID=1325564 RepID=A0A1W1IA89_9BACT|nr:Putative Phage integrase (modular protein) [Nitrospira japonica]
MVVSREKLQKQVGNSPRLTRSLLRSIIGIRCLFLPLRSNAMNIRRIQSANGTRSVLTYWYRGKRYRPVLGRNLTTDQERESARTIINAIHDNCVEHEVRGSASSRSRESSASTFAEFVPMYLQYLQAKRPDNDGRNQTALTHHLVPHFGNKRLLDIRLEDGLAYLEKRRSDLIGPERNKRHVASGTIERECAALMAVLNLAVDMDHLDKNRLKRLPVPEYVKRERIVEAWELLKIRESASINIWRLVMAALQIGLRENKLIEIHEEWLLKRGDGWWIAPSPGRSKIKGVPKLIPLNGLAYESLFGNSPRIGGRFFSQWKDGNSIKHTWMRTCERAGVHDLHFHDLRHTFTTWLTQCGVDYAVIQTLKGEPLPGSAKYYIHDWNVRLRDAVTRLESFTKAVLSGENGIQVPLGATCLPPSYVEASPNPHEMVPRDRIELSTPAFSGLCSTN